MKAMLYGTLAVHADRVSSTVLGWGTPEERSVLLQTSAALTRDSVIVELGAYFGAGTVMLLAGSMVSESRIHVVDTFHSLVEPGMQIDPTTGPFHGPTKWISENDFMGGFIGTLGYAFPNQTLDMLTVHRQSSEVVPKSIKQVDLLVVDADHFRALNDVETWLPLVTHHGMLLLHDVHADHYGKNSPAVAVTWLQRTQGFKVLKVVGGFAALTRDPDWWMVRMEELQDLIEEVVYGRDRKPVPDHPAPVPEGGIVPDQHIEHQLGPEGPGQDRGADAGRGGL